MVSNPVQLALPFAPVSSAKSTTQTQSTCDEASGNNLEHNQHDFHDWYRFVLSFPPHLVTKYIKIFGLDERHVILDPFCGTGTTLVECKRHNIGGIGLEANPFAHFASSVKVDWDINPESLAEGSQYIAEAADRELKSQGVDDSQEFEGDLQLIPLKSLHPAMNKLLITNSISPLSLHKCLILLALIRKHHNESYYRHALLALANTLVFTASNLKFGPEVGVGRQKKDAPVIGSWLTEVEKICRDLSSVVGQSYASSTVFETDSREINQVIALRTIDAVITSPPYPNEKDYTRTTRLESVVLGFINSKSELRRVKQKLIRSNTRGVYKSDYDDQWITEHPDIQRIARLIEERRSDLGKTSGFEKLYGRVTKLYFGGMARHLSGLRDLLRPGAQLAYVVGDQASYLQVMIHTGQIIAVIAQALGYELIGVDLFRTRYATATKAQLREEVVLLRWPGHDVR